MHRSKRDRIGISMKQSMIGKVAVMGLLERHDDGKSRMRTVVVSGREVNDFQPRSRARC